MRSQSSSEATSNGTPLVWELRFRLAVYSMTSALKGTRCPDSTGIAIRANVVFQRITSVAQGQLHQHCQLSSRRGPGIRLHLHAANHVRLVWRCSSRSRACQRAAYLVGLDEAGAFRHLSG